jgi:hypothetical protein
MKRLWLFLLAGSLLLTAGCSGAKTRLPDVVDLSFTYSRSELAKLTKGEPAVLQAWARPRNFAGEVVIWFEAEGSVQVDGRQETRETSVDYWDKVRAQVTVTRTGGYGGAWVTAHALIPGEGERFKSIYFYVTPEDVWASYTGEGLKTKYLKQLRARGVLTEQQFKEALWDPEWRPSAGEP